MAARQLIQARPKGTQLPMYSPQRDLAYFYPRFMAEAADGLASQKLPEDIAQLLACHKLGDSQLGQALGRWAKAHETFVNVPEVKTAQQALEQAGWYESPILARLIVQARLGDMLTGGFFVAHRDITRLGQETPHAGEYIAEMIAAGKLVSRYLGGDHSFLEEHEQTLKCGQLEEQVAAGKRALETQTRMTAEEKAQATQRNRELEMSRRRVAQLEQAARPAQEELEWYQSLGIYQLFRVWLNKRFGVPMTRPRSADSTGAPRDSST